MSKYKSLQPSWCAEMHGYVFAAAELGIKVAPSAFLFFLWASEVNAAQTIFLCLLQHVLKGHIQVRDVDARLPKTVLQRISILPTVFPYPSSHF